MINFDFCWLARRPANPPAIPTQRPAPAVPPAPRPLTTEQHTRHLALSHALRTPITAARELLAKAGRPDGDLLDLADTYAAYILAGRRSATAGPETAPGSPHTAEPAPGVAGEASEPQRAPKALRLPTLDEWEN